MIKMKAAQGVHGNDERHKRTGRCCKRLHMLFVSFSPASHTAYGQKPYIYAANENTGICNLPQTRAQHRRKKGPARTNKPTAGKRMHKKTKNFIP